MGKEQRRVEYENKCTSRKKKDACKNGSEWSARKITKKYGVCKIRVRKIEHSAVVEKEPANTSIFPPRRNVSI